MFGMPSAWLHLLEIETLEDDEADRHRQRELRFNDTTGALSGRLDAEGMATVRTALEVLAKPNPAADGTPDPRSAGQRLADALVELARRALNAGDLPASHGHRGGGRRQGRSRHRSRRLGAGWADLGGGGAPDRVLRRRPACRYGPDGRCTRSGSPVPHRHSRAICGADRSRWWLCIPGLHSPHIVVHCASHCALGRRWKYRPRKSGSPVRISSHGCSSPRLGCSYCRRPAPRVPPSIVARSRSTTAPQQPAQAPPRGPSRARPITPSPKSQSMRCQGLPASHTSRRGLGSPSSSVSVNTSPSSVSSHLAPKVHAGQGASRSNWTVSPATP